jgi:hypothetical protein
LFTEHLFWDLSKKYIDDIVIYEVHFCKKHKYLFLLFFQKYVAMILYVCTGIIKCPSLINTAGSLAQVRTVPVAEPLVVPASTGGSRALVPASSGFSAVSLSGRISTPSKSFHLH